MVKSDKKILDFEDEKELIDKYIPKEQIDAMYNKVALLPSPYAFVLEYCKVNIRGGLIKGTNLGRLKEHEQFQFTWANMMLQETSKDVNDSIRLLEIEPNLLDLVLHTKNEIFWRPLFFKSVFINVDIPFENIIVRGILVIDHSYINQNKDWTIFLVAVDPIEKCEFYMNFTLVKEVVGHRYIEFESEDERMNRLKKFIRRVTVNIVDMVEGNRNDLDVIIIETTREHNLKRIKRGKIQVPTKVYIRPKEHFKKYLNDFKEKRDKISIKFMVMGFWRHFRSDIYKEKKGTKIWIYPFWKGKGIAIAKDYMLISEEETNKEIVEAEPK